MGALPDLDRLSHAEKDALILSLAARLDEALALQAQVAKLTRSPKTPDNSGTPPSAGRKVSRADKVERQGPRRGSLGRKGGGRLLCASPD